MTAGNGDTPTRILVVEQDSVLALELQSCLGKLGYDVIGIAPSGSEAVAKTENTHPDLLLMDFVLMGNMDGIQTAEAIHSRLDVPVVFLGDAPDEQTLQRAKITQPFSYLIKPSREHELHSSIEMALYKHRMEKQLRESEERYSLATQGANDGLWDWNVQSREVRFSPRWKSMLGYSDNQIGESPVDWFGKIHPADRERVEQRISSHLAGTSSHFESEYRILDASGAYRWMLCRGLACRDAKGKAYRIAGSQTDITDRKVYNPLTGLPNRILFMDRLEHAMRCAKPNIKAFGVAVIEVGDMKTIAASHGWIFADQVLCHLARKIQGCLSAQDTVAHFGEKDFMLLLEEVNEGKQAAVAASGLQRELEQPIQIDGKRVDIAPYIGITIRTRDYAYPDELIRDAYTAMQRAKDNGKGRIEIYDKKMRSSAVARLKLEADLRRALERREFSIHYQPIVNLTTGKVAGLEALVRWQHQDGLIYPKDFLSVVDSMKMLVPLERLILLNSCTQMSQWQARYGVPLTLNVNLCATHYEDPNLVKEVKEALRRSGLAPQCLRLEITEGALIDNADAVSRTLAQLQAMNVQLHLDDFGTGYSSLSCLNSFPINSLKVDRSFVGSLGLNEESFRIIQAIVALGKNLRMELIAEGIENITQLRMLQSLKCEYGQGYYFAKPMEPDAIEKIVSGQLPWIVAFESNDAESLPRAAEV
jgi:diguanylate cyclase (GGDEF)-like protein/PAS domain S-box-containing protein